MKSYPDIELQCPICQHKVNIGPVFLSQCDLDCLNCIKTDGISVVKTSFYRIKDDDEKYMEFNKHFTKMYFKLPGSDITYVWKWDYRNNQTTLYKVDRDSNSPTVHVFDEIMDINLNNYISKTKMSLLFG